MFSRIQSQKGFTLVELLIVIAIITILATFLIPSIGSGRERARRAKCLNNVRVLVTAAILSAEGYDGTFNNYPGTFGEMFPTDGGDLDLMVMRCPSSGTGGEPTTDGTDITGGDYTMYNGYTANSPGTNPFIYDTNSAWHGGYSIGFLAGNVKFETSLPSQTTGESSSTTTT